MAKDMNQEEFTLDLQKLRSELDQLHNKATASSESSSALGQRRKQAYESLGCHKDALSVIERIDKMSPDKLADFLRSFEPMFSGLLPQWKEQYQDMVDKANAQSDDMAGAMG
ncbi:hypothetical protein NBRC116590_02990 [Pelagimonas sp. KU-00592-HH]|uniref:hypothetical protein n=1 Tax=Pelagimonas sp. KU-00592-HH TaxID=3127651 RepID=UPI003106286E